MYYLDAAGTRVYTMEVRSLMHVYHLLVSLYQENEAVAWTGVQHLSPP